VRASAAIDSDDRIVLGRLLNALCRERAKPALGRTSVAPMPVPIKVRLSMARVTLTEGTACSAFALLDRRRGVETYPTWEDRSGQACERRNPWVRSMGPMCQFGVHVQEERYLEGSSGETATVPPPDSDRGNGSAGSSSALVLRAVD
jgi:hypothetical protein